MQRRFPALACAVVVALAGCGGGSSGGSGDATSGATPIQAVQAAATKTGDAGSSRVAFTIAMSSAGSQQATITGEGAFDGTQHEGEMTMDLTKLGAAAGGADLGEAHVIFKGLTVYMKFPFLQQMQPNMKPWIRFDLDALGKQQGVDLGSLCIKKP
jgi:hypothetical protein